MAFFPLMAVLEGGVRFLVDPLVVSTLRYYGLCPDQLPPNFYSVVSCVCRLNHTFDLQLDDHNINHITGKYLVRMNVAMTQHRSPLHTRFHGLQQELITGSLCESISSTSGKSNK